MSIAIGYVRVSTSGQAIEGVSLEAQQARIKAWCAANGYELRQVFTDHGISGKRTSNRPALNNAIAAVCRQKGAALVVYSLSRLARSTRDAINLAEKLEKAGADLVSLSEHLDTTSASGKMIFRLLAVLAEFERDLISERTRAALAHKRSKGERTGNIPFGFRLAEDGIHLVQESTEQATLRKLRSMKTRGLPWRVIAEQFNEEGVPTRNGQPWTLFTARKCAREQFGS
jgi:site-specific DNA recombinase